jgi:AraC family ethanolamine operon transcriptional activator
MPAALLQPGSAEALAQSIQELLADTLTPEARHLPIPRATREAHRVVRAADEYLKANLGQPIYRSQLCAALGVSLRKLHDSFIATTGMSPQTYLKTRRLMMARGALRRAGGEPALVKSVALAHGFWHFGHFARDYRMQFGESPSETRGAGPHPGISWQSVAGA